MIDDEFLTDNLTYENFMRSRSSPTIYDTQISEHNQNLLETPCKFIACPTSIDLDPSNPYMENILTMIKDKTSFEFSEKELYDIKVTTLDDKIIFHMFTKVHHYESISYKDIFRVLKNLRNKIIVFYPEIKEISMSDFSNPYDKLKFTLIYEIIVFLFHNTNIKINIYHNKIIYPTPNDIPTILKDNHNSPIGGHIGSTRMYNKLKDLYYWQGMKSQIENFVKTCSQCQQNKALRTTNKAPMEITSTSYEPLQRIALDIVGPLPESGEENFRYIVTFQDDLTKYSMAYPVTNSTAEKNIHTILKLMAHSKEVTPH